MGLHLNILNPTGAFGYFECLYDITNFTKAVVFSEIGKKTEVFVRFSTVGGESGSADTVRYVSYIHIYLIHQECELHFIIQFF